MANKENSPTKRPNCPICGTESQRRFRPFCSRRCADIDLSRWLSGKYAIPGGNADVDEDGDNARAAEAVEHINKTLDQGN